MKVFKKQICIEGFISRIPGLFPYIEVDEFGKVIKHPATDAVDGCYGRVIPNMIVDGSVIPYRTLIRNYHELGEGYEHYSFVEAAIGKFAVSSFSQFHFGENQTLVPDYIYASEAKDLLNELIRLKVSCETYKMNYTFYNQKSCCDCDEFNKRGGETMIELLKYLITYAEQKALELYNSSTNDTSYSFSFMLSGSYEDMGYFTPYTDSIIQKEFGDKYESTTRTNENGQPYEISIGVDEVVETDSKLKSLRCYTTYMNAREQYEKPEEGEDWLYFYRKGYVANYETVNDDKGNIMTIGDERKIKDRDNYVTNLLAYGSLIDDITVDAEEHTITFTYYLNAHLKAKLANTSTSEIDEYVYPFEYESGGVKQTETYFYAEGGELDELILSGDFDNYIGNTNNDSDIIPRRFETRKCAFTIGLETMLVNKTIWDRQVDIPYQYSTLQYTRNNAVELYNADIFKEDYLMGISFKPTVENHVNIQRGNNAAFERHIRLGEVKTLEDMENYMNGSFFNIQSQL